jgi:hypothetical protein
MTLRDESGVAACGQVAICLQDRQWSASAARYHVPRFGPYVPATSRVRLKPFP